MTEFERGVRAAVDFCTSRRWIETAAADQTVAALLPPVAPAGSTRADPAQVQAGDFLAENAKNAPAGDREAVALRLLIDSTYRAAWAACLSVPDPRAPKLAGAMAKGYADAEMQRLLPAQPAEERAVAREVAVKALDACLCKRHGHSAGHWISEARYEEVDAILDALSRARTGSEAQNG